MTLTAVRLLAGKLLSRCPADDPDVRLERPGGALKDAGGIQERPVVDLNASVNRAEDMSDDIGPFISTISHFL
jgi:hypothetical protein